MSSPSHDAVVTLLLPLAATSFFLLGTTLTLLQLDSISRKVLKPTQLYTKRRSDQKYKLQKALQDATLRIRQWIKGGYGVHNMNMEQTMTELLTTDKEMDSIIEQIMDTKLPSPVIVALDLDEKDERAKREYFLYLSFPPPSLEDQQGSGEEEWRRVQVPLVQFGLKLAEKFEEQLTSTALCFVADASSGLGSEVLGNILMGCGAGLAVIKEPAWMTSLACLIEKNIISKSKMEKVLFGLCRLDAWRVRNDVGESRTVVFLLPGQNCTPTLLPLLQGAFPCERHVFTYDGCSDSVARSLYLRSKANTTDTQTTMKVPKLVDEELRGKVPKTEFMSMPKSITSNCTITPLVNTVRHLVDKLAVVPCNHADTIECWMGSVDTFLKLKDDERKNGYLPYVLRMGFLMADTGRLGNGNVDNSDLALTNVLQFITGSRSRPLQPAVFNDAKNILTEIRTKCQNDVREYKLNDDERRKVEECVFVHKSILIGDKTLLDTVQPNKDWSLKAAKKLKSCLCCLPGEGDDEEEEEEGLGGNSMKDRIGNGKGTSDTNGGVDLSVPGAFAGTTGLSQRKKKKSRPTYVDGKAGFAFDPTAF